VLSDACKPNESQQNIDRVALLIDHIKSIINENPLAERFPLVAKAIESLIQPLENLSPESLDTSGSYGMPAICKDQDFVNGNKDVFASLGAALADISDEASSSVAASSRYSAGNLFGAIREFFGRGQGPEGPVLG